MSENQTSTETQAAEPANEPASEIETLKTELKEQQNKYLYLYADFENYKKRVIKERSELVKFGYESLVRELLQVVDNLDRALEHTENQNALVTGIKMVSQQMKDGLAKYGVLPVSTLGQKFDPDRHEAVAQEAATNPEQEGTVVREHQKGYTLHGRLLRPARVVVAVNK